MMNDEFGTRQDATSTGGGGGNGRRQNAFNSALRKREFMHASVVTHRHTSSGKPGVCPSDPAAIRMVCCVASEPTAAVWWAAL